jgi:TetR/AcrR family transcriptional repressor of nem operon
MTTKTKAAVTKGERSRQKIVETAAVLFNQKGFTGCSMGDIVAASGLEKGTLYGHFSTKEELTILAADETIQGPEPVNGLLVKQDGAGSSRRGFCHVTLLISI